jgi:hypothetical protein
VIVDHLSYEWIFWFGLIVVVVAIVATHLFVPESPVKSPARIDWVGAALFSAGLICLLVGVSQGNSWGWGSGRVLGLLVAAPLVLAVWIAWEGRVRQPLVELYMLRKRAVWTTNLTAFLVGFGMFGSFILIPQFVEVPTSAGFGFGASVTQAGLFLLPSALVMLGAGPISGWLGGRVGSRVPLLMGTATAAVSFGLIALAHDHRWEIYVGTTLLGLGIGFSFASMANLIVEAVEQTQTGVATGMNTLMRTVGGSIGGQISAAIVSGHVVAHTGMVEETGFTAAFAMSAIGALCAFLAALSIPTRRSSARAVASAAAAR